MRGAAHAMLRLSDKERSRGVVTHSSGNFAQAVSLAARSLGLKAYIVMPENAPEVKKNAVRGYGGEIIEVESTAQAREAKADELVQQYGATFLHPSNDLNVIIGQGTAALELMDQIPDLDEIWAPVGGGGLLAGCGLMADRFSDGTQVIGVEPYEMDDAYRSLETGVIQIDQHGYTIADGLRTFLGDINFPIIQQHIDRIERVKEGEIIEAMRLVWERMKIIIEPSAAVPIARLLSHDEAIANKRIGIIISGGNVDLQNLPFKS